MAIMLVIVLVIVMLLGRAYGGFRVRGLSLLVATVIALSSDQMSVYHFTDAGIVLYHIIV